MPGTMQLGHTVIYVSDLDTSREWYRQHLGMTVVVESPERSGCFLSRFSNTTARWVDLSWRMHSFFILGHGIPSPKVKRPSITSH